MGLNETMQDALAAIKLATQRIEEQASEIERLERENKELKDQLKNTRVWINNDELSF